MTELENDIPTICLDTDQHAVYSCICYFAVFKHPLKMQEVAEFTNAGITVAQVRAILADLLAMDMIFEKDGFYFPEKLKAEYIHQRRSAEQRFMQKQKTIKRYANLIAHFPFVESVSISGSCSKGLLAEDGDVDFFIITAPRKVWLCRTLLIAFKKICLFNSKKYFCVNYFVDSTDLEIPDKNAFVATEIKTLLPFSNKALFEKFLAANTWTDDFLPNKQQYNPHILKARRPRKYALGWLELLLTNAFGNWLDKRCFHLTLNTWSKKFPHFSKEEFDLNLRSKKNVSKHHPRGFQQKVLVEWNKKLAHVKVLA